MKFIPKMRSPNDNFCFSILVVFDHKIVIRDVGDTGPSGGEGGCVMKIKIKTNSAQLELKLGLSLQNCFSIAIESQHRVCADLPINCTVCAVSTWHNL